MYGLGASLFRGNEYLRTLADRLASSVVRSILIVWTVKLKEHLNDDKGVRP